MTHSFGGLFGSNTSLGDSGMAAFLVSGGEGGSSEALGIMLMRSSWWDGGV
jgi:hypothetical protein